MCNSTWQQFSHAIGQPNLEAASVLPEGWCVRPAPCVYTERYEADAAFSCSLYEVMECAARGDSFIYLFAVRPRNAQQPSPHEETLSFACCTCPRGTLSSRRADRPQLTRDRFRYTSELARLYGVKDAAVTPYVSLGQGWQRAGTTRHDIRQSRNTFSMDFDYDTAYSALIGAQINRKE